MTSSVKNSWNFVIFPQISLVGNFISIKIPATFNNKENILIPSALVINNSSSSYTFTYAWLHSSTPAVILGNKKALSGFFIQWHHIQLQVSNMASSRVLERQVQEEPRRAATANLDFCLHKYSLLIIIGRTAHLRQTGHISGDIERGTRLFLHAP